jgi:WD40 repeat protein
MNKRIYLLILLLGVVTACRTGTESASEQITSQFITETPSLAAKPVISPTVTSVPLTDTPLIPSSTPNLYFLPILQVITVDNADKVQLLQTLDIPGFQRGQASQCGVGFSPDGHWLVGTCGENPVPVWDVESGNLLQSLYPASLQIVDCAFDPDGKVIACGGFDNRITVWDYVTGEVVAVSNELASPVWELDFSPDGKTLVSGTLGDDLILWDPGTGEEIWNYNEVKGFLSVAFHPSGQVIAFGNRWGRVGVLDSVTGESIIGLSEAYKPIGDLTFSPSGKWLAAGSDNKLIYLWETEDYQLVTTLEGHRHYVNGVSFNPAETLLVSGSHDKTVAIWDINAQNRLTSLEGHGDAVLRVVFNPDGTLIASVSWDGTVRLWGIPGDE